MKNISIWKSSNIDFKGSKLNKDIECDVLIIGGGLTGISTYYHLRESNLNVVLVEQNKIGMGVTAGSTGKLTYLQGNIYNNIMNKNSIKEASLYLESQKYAIDLAKDIIEKNKIECDLVKSPSYVYTNKDNEIKKIEDLKEFLEENKIDVKEDNVEFVKSKYMISVDDTYLYNPVKFIDGLLKVVDTNNIYEDTSIIKCEKEDELYLCYTKNNVIKAREVVIASHYPYFNLPFVFPIKGNLEKSYLCSGKKDISNISLISYSNPFISIRNYQDYIIYLANSHNVAVKTDDKKNFLELEKKAKELDFDIEYMWSNIDIMTNDSLPYIGKINDNLYISTGYNTWGMTNGILGGFIVSEMILGKDNKYVKLFDPKRSSSGNLLEVTKDIYYSAIGMVSGMLEKSDKVSYDVIDGESVCIYKDEKGEHIVYRKCPHMGCNLIFNEVENTWDCPCHGSRFDIDGKCISGPSNKDVTYSKSREK